MGSLVSFVGVLCWRMYLCVSMITVDNRAIQLQCATSEHLSWMTKDVVSTAQEVWRKIYARELPTRTLHHLGSGLWARSLEPALLPSRYWYRVHPHSSWELVDAAL